MDEQGLSQSQDEMALLLQPAFVKAKFNIRDDELSVLRQFGETHYDEVNRFIDDFYVWMQGLPEFPHFFKNPALVERVKQQQVHYWHEFFKADITSAYLQSRVNIGAVHAKIGLPIHSYCAAMNFSTEWWNEKISRFRLGAKHKAQQSSDVTISLANAFNKLVQLDITIVTETYHQTTQEKLQETLQETQKIVQDVTRVTEAVVEGDYSIRLSEENNLSVAINKMIEGLNASVQESQREAWLKTGQNQLAEKLRGDLELPVLCANVVEFLAIYLNAKVGAFFLLEDQGKLSLLGSYAYQHRKHLSNSFEIGQGLIGQAVLEKKTMIIDDVPEGYLTISSGLGEADAGCILICPILFEGKVKAVVELGKFGVFEALDLKLVESVNEAISISIESAKNRNKMNALLKDSQEKSNALEVQSKELEKINQDLQDKADKIKASEEELKTQSEELQATNEELEEKTQALEDQKRSIEDKNKDLERSQKLLEEKASELQKSSRYKSEFLSNMSHELRTPLNSLLILAQSFMENDDGNLSDDQIEKAGVIFNSGKDLLNLINDILDLSKVEAGKLKLHVEKIRIDEFIQGLASQMRPLVEKKRIVFKSELDSNLPEHMQTDLMRVEQIVKNLLSNAIKFTDEGGQVTLRAHLSDRQGMLGIAVSDTGLGISKEDQAAIFEAFQQGDGSISRKYGGTGLGLTISRQLSELLGGEIQLESEPGRGSIFTLYLPIKMKIETSDTQKPEAPVQVQLDTKPARKTPLVLIIEDDENFKKILSEQMRKKGLEFITTGTANEGFELARSKSPTAIILDVGLPDMSGLDLLEKLRADKQTSQIPVHIISASDVKEKSLQNGAVGYMRKPIEKATISKLLDDASAILQEPVQELLIVDDNEIELNALVKSMESDSVNVNVAKTAKAAEEMLLSKRIHCMILDLTLPDMSGIELLERINDNEAIVQPTVIVHTAKDLTEEEERRISEYTPKIVLKSADAPQRLTDEVSLFLNELGHFPSDDKLKPKSVVRDHFDGRKVLLVDDDMRNNIALGSYLRKHGFDTVIADNGELALKCLERHQDVDLILMDIMMPVMDGYTAIKAIRTDKAHEDIPIVALTAKAMSDDREKCMQVGANDYLTKPVDLDKLFDVMRVWLKK